MLKIVKLQQMPIIFSSELIDHWQPFCSILGFNLMISDYIFSGMNVKEWKNIGFHNIYWVLSMPNLSLPYKPCYNIEKSIQFEPHKKWW